jgi:hypothetical protein
MFACSTQYIVHVRLLNTVYRSCSPVRQIVYYSCIDSIVLMYACSTDSISFMYACSTDQIPIVSESLSYLGNGVIIYRRRAMLWRKRSTSRPRCGSRGRVHLRHQWQVNHCWGYVASYNRVCGHIYTIIYLSSICCFLYSYEPTRSLPPVIYINYVSTV